MPKPVIIKRPDETGGVTSDETGIITKGDGGSEIITRGDGGSIIAPVRGHFGVSADVFAPQVQ